MHSVPASPHVVIRIRKDQLLRWGLEPGQVLGAVQTAYQGTTVGHIYEKNRGFAVTVILAPADRSRVSAISELPLQNAAGTYVFLGKVAHIQETSGRYEILHLDGRRV